MSEAPENFIITNGQLLKDTEVRTVNARHNRKTIDSLLGHVLELLKLSKDEKFTLGEQKTYADKAAAIKKILDEQSLRIMELTSRQQAFDLANLIRVTAEYDNADATGTTFALSYVLDFYDA